MQDTDCPTGQTCACHGAAYSSGAGNTCIQGNCRVDSDCGSGGYCSPAENSMSCGGVLGYYCHTAADLCVNDSDCGSDLQVCTYSTTAGHWECQMEGLCAL
jgi:Cys-rich repeat protein